MKTLFVLELKKLAKKRINMALSSWTNTSPKEVAAQGKDAGISYCGGVKAG